MNVRRTFLKLLGTTGMPLFLAFPFLQINKRKDNFSFKTVTFLKIPANKKRFIKIEDFLTNSTNLNYWKTFRTIKSRFIKQNKLFQIDRIALGNGLFAIPTYFKTKQDHLLFTSQINTALLEKELSKVNIHFHVKLLG